MPPAKLLYSTPESDRARLPWLPGCSKNPWRTCRFRSDGRCTSCGGPRHPAPAIGGGVLPSAALAVRI